MQFSQTYPSYPGDSSAASFQKANLTFLALRERKLDAEAYQAGFISGLLQFDERKLKIGLASWLNL